MQKMWLAARTWLIGKKTYIGGGLLIVAGVVGVALGKVSVVNGAAIVGFGISVCGFTAKSDRQHNALVAGLEAVATAGADIQIHNYTGAEETLKPLVESVVAEILKKQTVVGIKA